MYSSRRPPGIAPDALERRHNAGSDQMPVIRRHIADDVQSDGKFKVARIEIHQMVGPAAAECGSTIPRPSRRAGQ